MPLPSVHRVFKLGASFVVAGAILLVARPALAIGARANYVEVASWETGYQAQYTITNDGPGDITHWRVIFDLPAGSSPSSTWDSVRSGSGQHLIFDNAAWNGALAPGGSTSFGFVVSGLGRPVGCTINGGPCDTLAPLAMAPNHNVRGGLVHRGLAMAFMGFAPLDVNATPSGQRRLTSRHPFAALLAAQEPAAVLVSVRDDSRAVRASVVDSWGLPRQGPWTGRPERARPARESITVNPAYAAPAFREVIPLLHKGEKIVMWVPSGGGMPEPVVYEIELVDVAPKPSPSYSAVH